MGKKSQWLMRVNSIITSVIAILGLNSCREPGIGGGGGVVCMYGVPHSTLIASGDVKNEKGEGIKGIEIRYQSGSENEEVVLSGEDGSFNLTVEQMFAPESGTLYFSDIDEEANGSYESDSIVITPKYKGGDDWNQGTATVSDLHIVLKEKK